MTEKRFTIDKDGITIIDNCTDGLTECKYSNEAYLLCNFLNKQYEENKQLKQSNNEAIELILDGVVEMHDGKRDYAETIFNKAIKLLKGDIE